MSIVSIGRVVGFIGAFGLAALTVTDASAQANASAASAIAAKRKTLPSSLVSQYFQTPVTNTPVVGEVGGGAYQSFNGKDGPGAIYWSQSTGAHVIYGDLFLYFTNSGMEVKLGYPSTDPQPGNGVTYGCNSDTTVFQTFSLVGTPTANKATPRTMYTLCSNARGRVTRGQVTLTGATTTTTPSTAAPSRTSGGSRTSVEDDGRHDDELDAVDPNVRTPSSSSTNGRSVGGSSRSSGSRSTSAVTSR